MFTSDLNKNPNKLKKFLYSKFSPFQNLIKREKTEAGVSLKDVVSFVQTNLIKLYVEKGDTKAIYNFFSNIQHKNQIYIDYQEIDAFLSKQKEKTICNVTMALILENCGKLEKALQFWQDLETEEGCLKTV